MSYTDDDYWSNVSSTPEKYGLTPIGHLYDPWACYSFDDLCVWKHEDGRVFWATDSGCSCPSPFEDCKSLDDLTEVTNDTWGEFQDAVENHCLTEYRYDADENKDAVDEQAADRVAILAKVAGLLR